MVEFTIRVATTHDAALLADIERAADQRYLDSPYREQLDGSAIPDEAARRYCTEGRILVAEAQRGSVPWEHRVWMQLDIELLQGGVANAGAVARVGGDPRRLMQRSAGHPAVQVAHVP